MFVSDDVQAGFLTFGSSCMGLILNNYAAIDSDGLNNPSLRRV